MEQQPQKIRLTLSPRAQRYARRDAPREARLMASRGALPLPPLELATVLYALAHDPDPEIKSNATESLSSLPENVLDPVLTGPAHPALLSHLAHAFREEECRLEKIALNPAADDRTVAFLATLPVKRLVDIVSNNQERLLRSPEIVDALGDNPLTGRSVIERILTFLDRPPREEDDDEEAELPPEEVSDEQAVDALRAVLGDELGEFAQQLVEESGSTAEGESEESSLYALIQRMTVFQKIKLARFGNSEARSLLVRDRNKVVSQAAITSPKIRDNEVIGIAQSRNVAEEVVRIIAMNREWTRIYKVKLGLCMNPKCPLSMAVRFVPHLHDKDLRQLMRSKDVPAAVSVHARRALMKKGKL